MNARTAREKSTAHRYKCGFCGAERGYVCRAKYGSETATHKSRWDQVDAAKSLRIQRARKLLAPPGETT